MIGHNGHAGPTKAAAQSLPKQPATMQQVNST